MDKSAAQRIVKREFPRYQKMFHLQDWKIEFEYRWIESEHQTFGTCTADISYKSATIVLNHELFPNEKELVNTMRHEMIHVLHSSFDLYREAVKELVSDREFAAIDAMYSHCSEDAVIFIENILDKELKTPLMKKKREIKKRKKK